MAVQGARGGRWWVGGGLAAAALLALLALLVGPLVITGPGASPSVVPAHELVDGIEHASGPVAARASVEVRLVSVARRTVVSTGAPLLVAVVVLLAAPVVGRVLRPVEAPHPGGLRSRAPPVVL